MSLLQLHVILKDPTEKTDESWIILPKAVERLLRELGQGRKTPDLLQHDLTFRLHILCEYWHTIKPSLQFELGELQQTHTKQTNNEFVLQIAENWNEKFLDICLYHVGSEQYIPCIKFGTSKSSSSSSSLKLNLKGGSFTKDL